MSRPDRLSVTLTVEQLWQPVPGGSGTYVRELAAALGARPDVDVRGLSARHGAPPDPSWSLPAGLDVVAAPLPRTALYEAWNRARLPRTGGGADVVHATTWAVPGTRVPLVVTVHDLAFLRSPEHFTARGNAFFRRALDVVRREAAVVVTVSEATRDDCERAGIAPERLRVVPHGVRVPAVGADEVDRFRRRHGLDRPYVLWCGTVEPRKNLRTLLEAFRHVLDDDPGVDLVLVGPSGWGDASAETARAALALPEGRVHRLGSLSTADLHAAYAGAHAFCFPSLWEGFGLPVLEAMAHGLPVVTSAGTATAEVAGDAGLLVDPLDARALAAAIRTATGDRHDELAARSRARAGDFTWEACAARTVDAYRDALGS
ncbi:glycosyltransferase family 1 protein [Cellulomonas cellasea]|uniref:Glycosyltransferase involved in cell wall biosynthesis n=1 Tax=Cellulomonas cellasea TaxID=43670 RepID=A0A7W4YBC9_9CELL|nr:glycosyltransferase family 1 protein [Cellulomonas cellasea]MBB2922899.1 glycosyltransferase involved in cell wall biosynthesis [Cellulomonas cellasea]